MTPEELELLQLLVMYGIPPEQAVQMIGDPMGGTLGQMQQAVQGNYQTPLSAIEFTPPPAPIPNRPIGPYGDDFVASGSYGPSAIGNADQTWEDGSNAMTGPSGITDTGWFMPGSGPGLDAASMFGDKSFMLSGSQYPTQGGASIGGPINPIAVAKSLVSRGRAGAQQAAAAQKPVVRQQVKATTVKSGNPKAPAPPRNVADVARKNVASQNTADFARSNANKSSPFRGSAARQKGR